MLASELAERLSAKRVSESRWKAKCPAHEDKQPSLQITAGKTGAVLLKCWAGCDYDAIIHELEHMYGVKRADLCGNVRSNGRFNDRRHAVPLESKIGNTDLGNAMRFVVEHGENLRYVHLWKRWLWWDGKRWASDTSGYVARMAKQIPFTIAHEAESETDDDRRKALRSWANASESVARQAAMIELAKSDIMVAAQPEDFDCDPWLFNCATGTINLRTGEIRPHRREDLLRRLAPVDFMTDAPYPLWLAFLERVLPPAVRDFFQRAVGYSLTGDISEHALFLLWGTGANGKTVALERIQELLGDYGQSTKAETFMENKSEAIPNALAALDGARFVAISETDSGKRLAEGLVKDYTGGDTVAARFLHAEWFNFRPQFKLWIRTNHKPTIRGTDDGIWRRIKLIPFTVRIPESEQDKQLAAKLRAELPGILAWAIQGCLAWQRDGLSPPTEVRAATAAYRDEQDPLGGWLDECCTLNDHHRELVSKLWGSYTAWCEANEDEPLSKQTWGRRLDDRGIVSDRIHRGIRVRKGIALRVTGDVSEASVSGISSNIFSYEKKPGNSVTETSPVTHDIAPCPDHQTAPGGMCACWHRAKTNAL